MGNSHRQRYIYTNNNKKTFQNVHYLNNSINPKLLEKVKKILFFICLFSYLFIFYSLTLTIIFIPFYEII